MAEHSPLPWSSTLAPNGPVVIMDADRNNLAFLFGSGDNLTPAIREANGNLIVRAVNAVAGTQPGPVDLDVALCLADEALMGDFPAVGAAIQALVGEVVRLRDIPGPTTERYPRIDQIEVRNGRGEAFSFHVLFYHIEDGGRRLIVEAGESTIRVGAPGSRP